MVGLNLAGRVFIPTSFVPYVGISGGNSSVGRLTVTPGQDPTQLSTATANIVAAPVLHPDEQKILYRDTGNLWEIGVNDSPGDEVLIWDGIGGGVNCAGYNPAGDTIVFTYGAAGEEHKLFTIPADGTDQSGNETAIYTQGSTLPLSGADYNFDGTKVGFHSLNSASVLGIWVCDADGTNATQLDTSATQFSQYLFDAPVIAWMRAASKLAWNDGTLATPVWKLMDDDGTNVVTLVTLGTGDGRPIRHERWAPDDSYIVYKKLSDGSIYKAAADGSGETLLINPSVTPSGQTWVFSTRLYFDVSGDIYSCLLDGSDERNESGATVTSLRLLA